MKQAGGKFDSFAQKVTAVLIFVYTMGLIYAMFFGFGRQARSGAELRYNVIPFSTIKLYVTNFHHMPFIDWIINMGGNIVVFVPFGLALPIVFRWRLGKVLLSFVLFITLLEILQMLTRRGSFDIDDILMNSAAVVLGYGIVLWLRKLAVGKSGIQRTY
ncbi:VanZ family protein [Paenibacillus algorifonticola]|uniref:VanZ family protein n=1 Tax=Paenibacillus algorifonticola TaxID=684063 RepID=UPI003D2BE6CC